MEKKAPLNTKEKMDTLIQGSEIDLPSMSMLEKRVCHSHRVFKGLRTQELLSIDLSRSNKTSRTRRAIIVNSLMFLTLWKSTLHKNHRVADQLRTLRASSDNREIVSLTCNNPRLRDPIKLPVSSMVKNP